MPSNAPLSAPIAAVTDSQGYPSRNPSIGVGVLDNAALYIDYTADLQ